MQLFFAIDALIKLKLTSMLFTGISIGEYISANIDAIAKACMFTLGVQYILNASHTADCLVVITSASGDILGFYLFVIETMDLPVNNLLEWASSMNESSLSYHSLKFQRQKMKVLHLMVLACSNSEGSKGLGAILLSTVKAFAWNLLPKATTDLPGPIIVIHATKPLHRTYYNLHGFAEVTPSFLEKNSKPELTLVPMICQVQRSSDSFNINHFINAAITNNGADVWPENPLKAIAAELPSISNVSSVDLMFVLLWKQPSLTDTEAEAIIRSIGLRESYGLNELKKLWRMRQICYSFRGMPAPGGEFCVEAFEPAQKHIVSLVDAQAIKKSFESFLAAGSTGSATGSAAGSAGSVI